MPSEGLVRRMRVTWLSVVVVSGLLVGATWVVVNIAGDCSVGVGCFSRMVVESDTLRSGRWYTTTLCVNGDCTEDRLFASDTRDSSSDATSPTTAPPSPGAISFNLSDYRISGNEPVEVTITDPVTGIVLVDFSDIVTFTRPAPLFDCSPPPCWSASVSL